MKVVTRVEVHVAPFMAIGDLPEDDGPVIGFYENRIVKMWYDAEFDTWTDGDSVLPSPDAWMDIPNY